MSGKKGSSAAAAMLKAQVAAKAQRAEQEREDKERAQRERQQAMHRQLNAADRAAAAAAVGGGAAGERAAAAAAAVANRGGLWAGDKAGDRPARKQIDSAASIGPRRSANSNPGGTAGSYNIWYGRSSYREKVERVPAPHRW